MLKPDLNSIQFDSWIPLINVVYILSLMKENQIEEETFKMTLIGKERDILISKPTIIVTSLPTSLILLDEYESPNV